MLQSRFKFHCFFKITFEISLKISNSRLKGKRARAITLAPEVEVEVEVKFFALVFSLAITDAFRLVIVFFETRLDFAKRYILRVGIFPTTSGFSC